MQTFALIAVTVFILYLLSRGTIVSGGLSGIVEKMANAIKEFEGWFPGSVSYRNNNPGNIKDTGFAGYVESDAQGHAIFDTFDSGWAALKRKLERAFLGQSEVYLPSMTLYQFFGTWAEGNSTPYAEFVAQALGVDANARLEELWS